jgi:alpha-glucosidase
LNESWWKTAVVYQIYPRSFLDTPIGEWADGGAAYRAKYPDASLADTDGDGVGDLDGIRRKLDYLKWLGVDAIWLSPFYRSPMADFGYDVADYCDVDPLFGTLDDFDRLLTDAHDNDIKVISDWVPNHTSDQHPWFVESRSSRDNPKRDWYVWRDGNPDTPPNNWIANFTGESAWTWDDATGQWYLHLFLPEQPDLNWNNPEVVAAMHDTLRFWLDRGVDGFRMDVVHAIGKGTDLPDMPADLDPVAQTLFHDYPRTHELLRDIRKLLDTYDGERMTVGEVYILSTGVVAEYYGDGDELHLAFNFPPLHAPWDGRAWRRRIERVVDELDPRDAWPTWVLSNHDVRRHRTRYGSEAAARAAAVLLLTLRGTPFLYAGEELGLEDAVIPADRVVDPGGRDPCRAPIPWEAEAAHGWPTADTWLPFPPEAETRNAAALSADAGSILHLYRRLLEARRRCAALAVGEFALLPSPDGVVAYERRHGDERRVVLVNFTSDDVEVALTEDLTVDIASDGAGEGAPYSGGVPASGAMILR